MRKHEIFVSLSPASSIPLFVGFDAIFAATRTKVVGYVGGSIVPWFQDRRMACARLEYFFRMARILWYVHKRLTVASLDLWSV